ncbi:hypothetical protein [Methylobacterium sp. V23]|uniref:hypothetical protein n=1 Tax=Methylobacterium sp. V23 TaxID=2044878 RepID=UPI0011AFDAAA|nr:hypothetical protein [Methylobacterium sp. V23]
MSLYQFNSIRGERECRLSNIKDKCQKVFVLVIGSFLAGIISAPAKTHADQLQDKLCVINSAQKSPQVPGLSIVGSSTAAFDTRKAAEKLASGFGTLEQASSSLNPTFGFLDGSLAEAIRYQYSQGGPEAVKERLVVALAKTISGASMVELNVKVAGQDATFGYICAWSYTTSTYTVPLGLIR